MARSSGTSPIHAIHPWSYAGKACTKKKAAMIAAKNGADTLNILDLNVSIVPIFNWFLQAGNIN
jgi:hypothetical protein